VARKVPDVARCMVRAAQDLERRRQELARDVVIFHLAMGKLKELKIKLIDAETKLNRLGKTTYYKQGLLTR
jgi:hypothetical protein